MAHAMIFCDICNIGVSSEVTMHDHVKGRRHQQALGAVERRKAQARNSLYCHGFPPSTPNAALRSYFQQFGNVTRIMVETQRGCYCIVQYDSETPVQRALQQRNHSLFDGLDPLTVRPRKPINTYRRTPEVDRSLRKVKAVKEEEEQGDASHGQLMKTLLPANSMLDQMQVLYETLRLSDSDLGRRKGVCDYLHSVLMPFLPTCTIHQFGSSVNGFGMRGCDMDIFLDLHDNEVSLQWEETLRQKMKPVNLPYIREIQLLKTTEGPLMPSQLRPLSLVHRVKLLSRILMHHAGQCTEVVFVPSVRCPIVRFVHAPTGIKCDLSINNRLALRNTQLLKMCAEDRRVRLLVFAVRYWGRWKQVAGNQNCGPRLSNYCLSLLVLCYLANTTPPVLPSVQSLADLAGPDEKCIIEEWDCSLPKAVPASDNTQPADELLRGFFQFYSQLSLSSSVILTRPGKVLPLNDFLMDKISKPDLADFKVKAMAVQDPFVLRHNIAQNINNPLRDQLVREFHNAAAKLTQTSTGSSTEAEAEIDPTSTTSDHQTARSSWGLLHLFSSANPQPSATDTTQSSTLSDPSAAWCEKYVTNAKKPAQWTCHLTLNLSIMSQEVLTALQAKGDYRMAWFRRVRKLLLWALKDVFLFAVKSDQNGREVGEEDFSNEDVAEEVEDMCVDTECRSEIQDADPSDENPSLGQTASEGVGTSESTKRKRGKRFKNQALVSQGLTITTQTGQALSKAEKKKQKAGRRLSASEWGALSGDDRSSPPKLDSRCSSGEGQPSPMVISESPSSRKSSQCGKPLGMTSGQLQVVVAKCSRQPSSSVPCSPLSVSHISPQKPTGQGYTFASAEHCGDVEMVFEPDATNPSTSSMDSPRGLSDSRDVPHRCSMGEAASGTSSSPVQIQCSPVGDGKILTTTKGLQLTSSNVGIGHIEASSSVEKDLRNVSEKHEDVMGDDKKSEENSSQSTAQKSSVPRRTKQCKPVRVYCEGKVKAWYGRKVARLNLLAEGHADDLELEKLISKKLAERDAGCSLQALSFYCVLSGIPNADQAEAEVWFEPVEPVPKEFSVFTTFFKSFFTKLVSKNLVETATV
ncbi:uncharacterized protein [Littorina saxatilis]|uniref:Speckle targeted PIP5K1A-regulated poly(A) polymerase n=1 Tax=Littorina saxatilis TaxID=31220 RepID=A0AAN9G2L5_9CAEN